MPVPEKPSLEGLEDRWQKFWESGGTYKFYGDKPRSQVFSIDTPPPTVSGSLHVGHVFSYTHTDTLARYKRMNNFDVFYPMGWDDNGLPTERRVQNYFGVSCDPSLEYIADFQPPEKPDPKNPVPISRANFVELCLELTEKDEKAFEKFWKNLGLSVDWSHTYTTISESSRHISQLAFLRNFERSEAYIAEAPCLWDINFQTAVAQAELEDREIEGAYHRVAFSCEGEILPIETTRPELIPACVALVAHPEDARYEKLFGKTAVSPLFNAQIPILPHKEAEPEKGTGIAMVCTFGDMKDVVWWRELDLPVKPIMGRNGLLVEEAPEGIDPEIYGELAGLHPKKARKKIAEMLTESKELMKEPQPITHPVKFFEKGEQPLEIITTRQWYLTNGGRDKDLRDELYKKGGEINWIPEYMQTRYEDWVGGLNGDWLISRQRYFGVPIPLWYRLDENQNPDYGSPITPDTDNLPIDPSIDAPPGIDESMRGKPGGFIGDPDVMDTWATSSLTPFIACGWETNSDLFEKTFPMDVRPQAHEIIRTWLFSTLVRSHLEGRAENKKDTLPWKNAAISGWVLDPDRKKMSKSKGNVVTPLELVPQYGADAIRYWACCGRPGTDTAFEEGQIKNGRRLAVKILNASKFTINLVDIKKAHYTLAQQPPDSSNPLPKPFYVSSDDYSTSTPPPTTPTTQSSPFAPFLTPLDADMVSRVLDLAEKCTAAFEDFDYARSLEMAENFFWSFTDDYIELVKTRAYGQKSSQYSQDETNSAKTALQICLLMQLQLFAPFMPFVTEEVWSWIFPDSRSIHKSAWPNSKSPNSQVRNRIETYREWANYWNKDSKSVFPAAQKVISQIRKHKSEAKVSLNSQVDLAEITASQEIIELIKLAQDDIKSAGKISELKLEAQNTGAAGKDGEIQIKLKLAGT